MEQEILRCFDAFDRGQKGYLDKDDLKVAATALLGRRPTKFEVQKWIRSAGTRAAAEDGEGEGQGIGVDRAAFLGIMSPILAQVDDLDRMRCAFKAFDISCRGFITMKDFRAGMSEACPAMPEAQVEDLFREVDWDSSGRIDWMSFLRIMHKCIPANPLSATGF